MKIFFIFNCRSQSLSLTLLLTKPDAAQDDTEDFQCDVCLLCAETKAAAARGLLGVVGSPANRQEGKTTHNVQRPIPFRTTTSVSQRAPLRAPGSRATPVKTQQKLPSLCARCCVKTAELALSHSEMGHNDGEDERKRERKKSRRQIAPSASL